MEGGLGEGPEWGLAGPLLAPRYILNRNHIPRNSTNKPTTFLTNSEAVCDIFQVLQCDKSHEHTPIIGMEGGVRRSAFAARYPPMVVERLVDALLAHFEGVWRGESRDGGQWGMQAGY